MIKRLEPTVRDLLFIELAYGILAEGIGLVFAERKVPYTLGILAGYALVIFLVCHMYLTLEKALSFDPKRATKYSIGQSVFRYVVTAAVVLFIGWLPWISAVSVMVMLFGLKISAHLQPKLGQYINKIFKEGR